MSFLLFCAAFAAGMEIAMARKVEMTQDFRVVAAIFCVLVGLLLAAYFLLPDPTLAP